MRGKSSEHKNVNGAPGQTAQNINRPRPNINGSDRRTPMEAMDVGQALHEGGSNKRTVWAVNTFSFPDAHFATFPERLIEPCILSATSHHGNCAECGKPYTRIYDRVKQETTGWKKPCTCETEELVRPIVYDPFSGARTTMLVSQAHGRDYSGHELSEKYMKIGEKRQRMEFGVFAKI